MRRLVLPLFALIGLSVVPAWAAEPDGHLLSQACTSCHGIDGVSQGAIPSLAGRPRDELVTLMTAFREQKVEATIMNRLMIGYSDAEIAALADYFSTMSTSK